jgi:excisionase family DNA binding protein
VSERESVLQDEILTVAEVAERCKLHKKTVLRAIHRGKLRASQLGVKGAYRIRPADVDAWFGATQVHAQDELPGVAWGKVRREPPPNPRQLRARGTLVVGDDMGKAAAG